MSNKKTALVAVVATFVIAVLLYLLAQEAYAEFTQEAHNGMECLNIDYDVCN